LILQAKALGDLLGGDLIAFVSAVYTDPMGNMFGAILLLTLFIPIYVKTESVGFMAVLAFLVFGSLEVVMPAAGINFTRILLVLVAGYLLYSAYASVRR